MRWADRASPHPGLRAAPYGFFPAGREANQPPRLLSQNRIHLGLRRVPSFDGHPANPCHTKMSPVGAPLVGVRPADGGHRNHTKDTTPHRNFSPPPPGLGFGLRQTQQKPRTPKRQSCSSADSAPNGRPRPRYRSPSLWSTQAPFKDGCTAVRIHPGKDWPHTKINPTLQAMHTYM